MKVSIVCDTGFIGSLKKNQSSTVMFVEPLTKYALVWLVQWEVEGSELLFTFVISLRR